MTFEERDAFRRRTTDAFLKVALQTALARIGALSGPGSEEELRQFERAFDRGLRTLPSPKGAEFVTMAAAEDAVVILRDCIAHARQRATVIPA